MKIISLNFLKNFKGKCYSNCIIIMDFYEVVLLMFGLKVCIFVVDNFLRFYVYIVMEWYKLKIKLFDFIEFVFVIKMVLFIYKLIKYNFDERWDIFFMFMEDEKVIE